MTNKSKRTPTQVTTQDVAEVFATVGGVAVVASVFIRLDSTGVYTVQGDPRFHTREYPAAVAQATAMAWRQVGEQCTYSVVTFS